VQKEEKKEEKKVELPNTARWTKSANGEYNWEIGMNITGKTFAN